MPPRKLLRRSEPGPDVAELIAGIPIDNRYRFSGYLNQQLHTQDSADGYNLTPASWAKMPLAGFPLVVSHKPGAPTVGYTTEARGYDDRRVDTEGMIDMGTDAGVDAANRVRCGELRQLSLFHLTFLGSLAEKLGATADGKVDMPAHVALTDLGARPGSELVSCAAAAADARDTNRDMPHGLITAVTEARSNMSTVPSLQAQQPPPAQAQTQPIAVGTPAPGGAAPQPKDVVKELVDQLPRGSVDEMSAAVAKLLGSWLPEMDKLRADVETHKTREQQYHGTQAAKLKADLEAWGKATGNTEKAAKLMARADGATPEMLEMLRDT